MTRATQNLRIKYINKKFIHMSSIGYKTIIFKYVSFKKY